MSNFHFMCDWWILNQCFLLFQSKGFRRRRSYLGVYFINTFFFSNLYDRNKLFMEKLRDFQLGFIPEYKYSDEWNWFGPKWPTNNVTFHIIKFHRNVGSPRSIQSLQQTSLVERCFSVGGESNMMAWMEISAGKTGESGEYNSPHYLHFLFENHNFIVCDKSFCFYIMKYFVSSN